MRWDWCKKISGLLAAGSAAVLARVPAMAQASVSPPEIPMTGDASKMLIPAMIVLLAVSAVLLTVYLVLSKKKK